LAEAHITELDLIGLKAMLASQGWQVRSEFHHSERQVRCQLRHGYRQCTVFWLEKATAGGEASEDQGDGAEDTYRHAP